MNVETNLIEEEYDDDDDDAENDDGNEKEQQHHGELSAKTNSSTVVIIHHDHDDDENDQPLSSMHLKKTRIRKRDDAQKNRQQQQQPSSSAGGEQQQQPSQVVVVLLSPQQQQQPRRQRQRIVIQFENDNNNTNNDDIPVGQEEDEDENENQHKRDCGQDLIDVTVTETAAAAAVTTSCSPPISTVETDAIPPAAAAAVALGSSSSFFSTEWLVTSSAPSSPKRTTTVAKSPSTTTPLQGKEHERPLSAPAALLLLPENDDDDNGTIPSTSGGVCGMGGGVSEHHQNMSHGLRLLFQSKSSEETTTGKKRNSHKKKQESDKEVEEEDDSDDDSSSVQSTPYFETSDVAPIHWAQTLTEHEVMVGLAVVAITISLAHPLLFLAGSLTALGTATAVGAGYDYVTEGPIGRCLGLTTPPPAALTPTTTTSIGTHRRSSSTSIPYGETTAAAAAATATKTQESVNATFETVDAGEVSAPVSLLVPSLLEPEHDQNDTPTATVPATVTTNPRSDSAATSSGGALMDVPANGTAGGEQVLPENWISVHYPPLEHHLFGNDCKNKNKNSSSSGSSSSSSLHPEFQGLDVLQFFNVFYSDQAPFTYMEFQKKRGDKDIVYGRWKEMPSQGPLSMHPASATTTKSSKASSSSNLFPLAQVDYIDYQYRILTFQTKTNNSFLGPPYATTTKEQRILIVSKKLAILEMKTTLADIPFCDRFHILERYIIQAEKALDHQPATSCGDNYDSRSKLRLSHNHKNHHHHHHFYHCRITNASCQVFFQKSCPFETQIRTRSYASIEDVTTAWCHMATQALLLAERAKLDRQTAEQQQQKQENSLDGFADEKKENEDGNTGFVPYRNSNSMLDRDISQVTNGASQLSACGGGDDEAVLDVDFIEVTRSPNSRHAFVIVQDSHDHDHRHDKGPADVGDEREIPNVVRIPTLSAAVVTEERIDKKISTAIRNMRPPWHSFKFKARASRPSSFLSAQSSVVTTS